MGAKLVAILACLRRDAHRPTNRALHPVTWRQQPPVLSPVSPRSLVGALASSDELQRRCHEQLGAALVGRYRAADGLLTDSGTSALVLALRALVKPGGIVAYPAYACIDLTAAAVRAGVRVRLYDLDPSTLSPDLDSVRRVLKRGADAIVVVHFFGYPADIVAVRAEALTYGTSVIEDAAQGASGRIGNDLVGSFGDVSVLSFGRGKGITGGHGGAILVRRPDLVPWLTKVRNGFGQIPRGGREVVALAGQWTLSHPLLYRIPASIPALKLGEMVYQAAGEPAPMPGTAATILVTALNMEAHSLELRRARANELLSALGDEQPCLVPVSAIPRAAPGYLRLAVLDRCGAAVPATAFGAVRPYPLTLAQHRQLEPQLLAGERAGPGALFLRDRLFTVPTHAKVDARDVRRIAGWLNGGGESGPPSDRARAS
ncbi:MAG: DegT/DnrJ/EryC1/StrS family aminotransferase [Gemmatimonadaceae bacterium]